MEENTSKEVCSMKQNVIRFLGLYSVTAFPKATPLILEPIMSVEVNIPQEFQVRFYSRTVQPNPFDSIQFDSILLYSVC